MAIKLLSILPAIFGLIIITVSSIGMFLVERKYEPREVKIVGVGIAEQNQEGEFLAGVAITVKDSIETDVILDDLKRLGFCKDRADIEKFLVKCDSLLPIWLAPGAYRSKVRMGAAQSFDYFIEAYIDALIFSILLCIPFAIINLLEKTTKK